MQEKWKLIPENSCLLVIDMQNDFVLEGAIMEVPDAKGQAEKIKGLIEKSRENNIPVIYTVHVTDPEKCPLEILSFPHLKNAGMRIGTKGVEIIDKLKPENNEVVIYKNRFSAFFNTNLQAELKKMPHIDTIIICGTVANICCESTARDAFFRDYKVVFGSDICSSLDQSTHIHTLKNMEIFGRVLSCSEIILSLQPPKL